MHNFKGAIFDMDGTLLDSMPVWKRLTQGYLAQFGVHITDQDYAVTEGFSQPQVAQYFADRYPDLPVDAQGIMDGMDELITARYETIARPKDGVLDFLEGLRRRGVKMAVATLTARRHAEKALRDRDMLDYFDFRILAYPSASRTSICSRQPGWGLSPLSVRCSRTLPTPARPPSAPAFTFAAWLSRPMPRGKRSCARQATLLSSVLLTN